jgi:hypothetical protein
LLRAADLYVVYPIFVTVLIGKATATFDGVPCGSDFPMDEKE